MVLTFVADVGRATYLPAMRRVRPGMGRPNVNMPATRPGSPQA